MSDWSPFTVTDYRTKAGSTLARISHDFQEANKKIDHLPENHLYIGDDNDTRTPIPLAGLLKVKLIAGGTAGDHTLAGIDPRDELSFVGHFSTAAAIATLDDLTAEFSITAADTINNAAGTNTTSDLLMIMYLDLTPEPEA